MTAHARCRRRTPFGDAFPPGATALVVIDMQRDFVEPGGFGASLGNDVTLLHRRSRRSPRCSPAWRERGLAVVHTREAPRPDLSDRPPAKRLRGKPEPAHRRRRSDGPGADRRRAGRRDRAALAPQSGEIVVDKPGKGMF